MFQLIGIGEILWDLLPSGRQLGGAPANFAYHANALGARGQMISRVGQDELGADILKRLRDLGLSTDLIQIDGAFPTSTVSVEVSSDGQPRYIIHEQVAWDYLSVDEGARQVVARANAICFGTLAQRSEESRRAIHELIALTGSGCLRILDVNLRQAFYTRDLIEQSLRAANVLKVNDGELPVLAEFLQLSGDSRAQLAELARRFNLRLVAYTRGANGSVLLREGHWSDHPGIPVKVADTIGAGDSFTAAMALGYLSGHDLDEINDHANRVASFVASQPGGTPTLPPELRLASLV